MSMLVSFVQINLRLQNSRFAVSYIVHISIKLYYYKASLPGYLVFLY